MCQYHGKLQCCELDGVCFTLLHTVLQISSPPVVDELGDPDEVEGVEGVVDITNEEALSLLQMDSVAGEVTEPMQPTLQADLEIHGVLP